VVEGSARARAPDESARSFKMQGRVITGAPQPATAEAQIVHWNRPYQCLRTVGLLSKCAEVLKLRLLDNGSDRAKLAELKEQLPQKVEIIELGRNLGWGPAHNSMRSAGGDE